MADPIIKFTPDGEGGHFYGIPAKSLSKDDYDALTTEQRATVRASKLYDYAGWRDATALADDRAAKAVDKAVAKPDDAPAKDVTKS